MLRALANKIFGGGRDSKALAKSRLHFVLVQDRTGLSNDQMAKFRGELVQVIQRYFVIDEQGFDISYERQEESTTLLINSPVVVKRQAAEKGIVGSDRSVSQSAAADSPARLRAKASAAQESKRREAAIQEATAETAMESDSNGSAPKRRKRVSSASANSSKSKGKLSGSRSGSRRSRRAKRKPAAANA